MQGLLVLILLIPFWFILVVPQRKRQREHLAVLAALAVGQRVMTVGGIIGTVAALDEETVRIQAAPGVELTLGRSFIRQRIDGDQEVQAADAADERAVGSADPEVEDHVTPTADGTLGAPTNEASA